MLDKQTVAYLRYVHASYNMIMTALFLYQGNLGLRIRKQRKTGDFFDVKAIKKHRKAGYFFTIMGISGFISGLTIVYVDYRHILEYPLHFFTGSVIAVSLLSTYLISRKIKQKSIWRTPHFMIGILIICLYIFQLLLGMGILL